MPKIVFEEVDHESEREVFIDLDDYDYGYYVSVDGEYLSIYDHDGVERRLLFAEPSHAIEDILERLDIEAVVEYKDAKD